MEQKINILAGQFRYLPPRISDDIFMFSDATLIYIEEILHFEHKAAVFMKYRHVAGSTNNPILEDMIVAGGYYFATISYVDICRLAERDIHPKEKWLNEKRNPTITIGGGYPYYGSGISPILCTNDLPQQGSTNP